MTPVPAERTRRFVVTLGWSTVALAVPLIAFGFYPWYMVRVLLPAEGLDPVLFLAELGISVEAFLNGGWSILISGLLFLVASIGLAKLQEWARIVFIVMLGATVAFNALGLIALMALSAMITDFSQRLGDPEFEATAQTVILAGYVLTVLTSVLFGWLMWRLTRDDVLELFRGEAG